MTPERQINQPANGYRTRMSYGTKIILMGVISGVLMFGVLAVWIVSYSRESNNRQVAESIANQWGNSIHLQGPIAKEHIDSANRIHPMVFDCNAVVETKLLHRNIYEAQVFTANIKMTGCFNRNKLLELGDTVVLELKLPSNQIVKLGTLNICGKETQWQTSTENLFAKINPNGPGDNIEFSTELEVRGSGSIFIKEIGDISSISINGNASNPSFTGSSLPIERTTRDGRFSASWENSVPDGITYTDDSGFVGTNFLVGVDRYQKVERSMKYSFIIIILTFISVLFVEIMKKQTIPLLNYFLIGVALIIFYSLLLSFVELIPFGYAYLLATTMTVSLITVYMWKILHSRKLGLSIGGLLSLMYVCCYIMLNMSTYALLLGSLLLFFSLAAMMYASIKINSN